MSVNPVHPADQPDTRNRAGTRARRTRLAAVVAVAALAFGGAGCSTSTSSDATDTSSAPTVDDTQAADTTATPDTTAAPETTAAAETTAVPETLSVVTGDAVEGAPTGVTGSRSAPVPTGEIADVGDGWRLQVLNVIEDGTALVLEENQFNEQPPAGTRFTLVQVALGYFGTADPASDVMLTISGVAAANRELDRDCGVLPGELPLFQEYFAGGVAVGNICFVTEPSDAGALQLYASSGFGDNEVFLAATAPAALPAVMAGLPGPREGAAATDDRLAPTPVGAAADLGDGWSVTVTGPMVDITDATMAENQFNSPPPPGFRFVGVPVAYAFNGSGSASGFDVTMNGVADSNVDLETDCGVIPTPIDVFADVFSGGALTGNLCFVVPAEMIGSVVLYGSVGFDGRYTYFATS